MFRNVEHPADLLTGNISLFRQIVYMWTMGVVVAFGYCPCFLHVQIELETRVMCAQPIFAVKKNLKIG